MLLRVATGFPPVAFGLQLTYNSSVMDNCLCLCELLKAASAACERDLNNALSAIGISHCQASILVKLQSSGPFTMSAVSKELCCHKSNVTQVVDGLAARGLIERKTSREDRRVSVLTLTAKGRALGAKAQTALAERARGCVGCFSVKERNMLVGLLERAKKLKDER